MNKKCSKCRPVNYADADNCRRCDEHLDGSTHPASGRRLPGLAMRAIICVVVCISSIAVFYLSLIASSRSLSLKQRDIVERAETIIRDKGFDGESKILQRLAVYRASDNWFNALIPKENAFAATNFPFGIMTLYPDFFTYPVDDVERAAILLHEARHLKGGDEKDAYEFVWLNRAKLGWTKGRYAQSPVWNNIRRQTREYAPDLFTCEKNDLHDCTEP